MKQLLKWLGYLVMGSQIFTLSLPILSTIIAGYSLKYLLFYLLIFGVNCLWILKKICVGKITITELGVAMLVLGPAVIGAAWGWSMGSVVLDLVHMTMPIVIYQWVDLVSLKKDSFVRFFGWISVAAGVVSVLVALGVIDAGIWAQEGDYVRSAGAVDSTIGIMAVCIAMVYLYVYPEKAQKNKILIIAMLISGIITTVFSQSRTRIALIAVVVGIVLIYNVFNSKSKLGTLRLLVLLFVVACVVMIKFPDVVEQLLSQVFDRFEGTGDAEGNVLYRQYETAVQMAHFWDSPLFGKGYGSISAQDNMYFHNIYSALLMQGGLLFGGIYIIWMISYLLKAIQGLLQGKDQRSAMTCLLIMLVLLVLGFTNGGVLQSGGYCAVAYVFVDDKLRREETADLSRENLYAYRNSNLSQSN